MYERDKRTIRDEDVIEIEWDEHAKIGIADWMGEQDAGLLFQVALPKFHNANDVVLSQNEVRIGIKAYRG